MGLADEPVSVEPSHSNGSDGEGDPGIALDTQVEPSHETKPLRRSTQLNAGQNPNPFNLPSAVLQENVHVTLKETAPLSISPSVIAQFTESHSVFAKILAGFCKNAK